MNIGIQFSMIFPLSLIFAKSICGEGASNSDYVHVDQCICNIHTDQSQIKKCKTYTFPDLLKKMQPLIEAASEFDLILE